MSLSESIRLLGLNAEATRGLNNRQLGNMVAVFGETLGFSDEEIGDLQRPMVALADHFSLAAEGLSPSSYEDLPPTEVRRFSRAEGRTFRRSLFPWLERHWLPKSPRPADRVPYFRDVDQGLRASIGVDRLLSELEALSGRINDAWSAAEGPLAVQLRDGGMTQEWLDVLVSVGTLFMRPDVEILDGSGDFPDPSEVLFATEKEGKLRVAEDGEVTTRDVPKGLDVRRVQEDKGGAGRRLVRGNLEQTSEFNESKVGEDAQFAERYLVRRMRDLVNALEASRRLVRTVSETPEWTPALVEARLEDLRRNAEAWAVPLSETAALVGIAMAYCLLRAKSPEVRALYEYRSGREEEILGDRALRFYTYFSSPQFRQTDPLPASVVRVVTSPSMGKTGSVVTIDLEKLCEFSFLAHTRSALLHEFRGETLRLLREASLPLSLDHARSLGTAIDRLQEKVAPGPKTSPNRALEALGLETLAHQAFAAATAATRRILDSQPKLAAQFGDVPTLGSPILDAANRTLYAEYEGLVGKYTASSTQLRQVPLSLYSRDLVTSLTSLPDIDDELARSVVGLALALRSPDTPLSDIAKDVLRDRALRDRHDFGTLVNRGPESALARLTQLSADPQGVGRFSVMEDAFRRLEWLRAELDPSDGAH